MQVEEDEGQWIDDYGDGVQHTGLVHQHLQANLQQFITDYLYLLIFSDKMTSKKLFIIEDISVQIATLLM